MKSHFISIVLFSLSLLLTPYSYSQSFPLSSEQDGSRILRTCLIRFNHNSDIFSSYHLAPCLKANEAGQELQLDEVLIFSSSSPNGRKRRNHELVELRAKKILEMVLSQSPQTRIEVKLLGATSELGRSVLVYAFFRKKSPTQDPKPSCELSSSNLASAISMASTMSEPKAKNLNTYTLGIGRKQFRQGSKVIYTAHHLAVERPFPDLLPSSSLVLVLALSYNYLAHTLSKDLHAISVHASLRQSIVDRLDFDFGTSTGVLTDQNSKQVAIDIGVEAALNLALNKDLRLGVHVEHTRLFTGASLGLSFKL
ncbi:MAG: hypothetical protein KA436_05805 [Oligoflexales bacterium]|nr:hypothetical protein [Oligoflexales bacterium]